ncbi:hypothetical protein KY290_019447 [Solanum tuberosum]|uniref:Uncharacterized protein n=1 Tax=Solanum tuberosum TaxID=4113 RepID=A0ABQ7VIF3_SOLTU|nr:hypothetical protein KY289_037690 [Solanum tuberosum]KAH0643580.1 hypothetical protein KY289_034554 [Solanum tuberosum]KAH0646366.1 hypothetical protein KY284_034250 [Solanum tuberosum]KAH0674163.1 hypothetical protein KY284_025250 [Solanum tuberosum]KAH0683460.1 hypothetical protein KY289_021212 [Solanum tuberosum]
MQEVFQKVIAVADSIRRRSLVRFAGIVGATVRERWVSGGQVSWWMKGRYLTNFAGASLEQGRLSSIAIRGGFVLGASPEKMESRQWCWVSVLGVYGCCLVGTRKE